MINYTGALHSIFLRYVLKRVEAKLRQTSSKLKRYPAVNKIYDILVLRG